LLVLSKFFRIYKYYLFKQLPSGGGVSTLVPYLRDLENEIKKIHQKKLDLGKISIYGFLSCLFIWIFVTVVLARILDKFPFANDPITLYSILVYFIYSSIFWLWVPLFSYSMLESSKLKWGYSFFLFLIVLIIIEWFLLRGFPNLFLGIPILECRLTGSEGWCGIAAAWVGVVGSLIGIFWYLIAGIIFGIMKK